MSTIWLSVAVATPWLAALAIALLPLRWRQMARAITLGAMVVTGLVLAEASWIARSDSQAIGSVSALWRLDALAAPFVLNLLLVSLGALVYAWGYWEHVERPHLCYALTLAFIGSMLGTLLSNRMLAFFLFWEAMLVTSALLIAGWGDGPRIRAVTYKYVIFTQAGSLLILASLAWLSAQGGDAVLATLPDSLSHLSPVAWRGVAILLFLGFGIKLAIAPLHLWLPDAHSVAPMPVTILLAGAMLSMGAYGMLRFPLALLPYAEVVRLQLPLLLIALASQVYGALMCFAERDIKRIVAYSSVSQMGYLLFAMATLVPQGLAGALMHVVSHGLLKALLFIGVGLVMWATGRRSLDELGGLRDRLPIILVLLLLGAVGIAGVPPLCAFYSEWFILSGGLASAYPLLGLLACGAPLLTTAYALWLVARLAFGEKPSGLTMRAIPRMMVWSGYLMGGLALAAGLFPSALLRLGQQAAALLIPGGAW